MKTYVIRTWVEMSVTDINFRTIPKKKRGDVKCDPDQICFIMKIKAIHAVVRQTAKCINGD